MNSRSWYIAVALGAVVASAMIGCKRDQIERHRVMKLPAESAPATGESSEGGSTNTGRLPAGHPDITAMNSDQMQAMAAQMPSLQQQPLAGGDVTFTLPDGWTEKHPPGPMLLHEFSSGDARTTISMLGGDGGGLLANVNRWRGQPGVNLPPVDQEGLMQLVKPVSVDGVEGWRVDLTGNGAGANQTLGVIVMRDSMSWFFKLSGSNDAVSQQIAAFDQFIRTVKWPAPRK